MNLISPLVDIRDLHIAFSTNHGWQEVLHGISLQVYPGETVALVGESGSGKSVTAQAIIQQYGMSGKITEGQIWFDGENLALKTPSQMQVVRGKSIGMIFQDPMTSLNPTMRIGWQIAEMLCHHEGLTRKHAKIKTIDLLHSVGIADPTMRFEEYPFQLSGGMRQRVMIAMALSCRPKLLIADEPTTALDVTIQAQILDLLQKMQRDTGMSILLITHDLGVVAGNCDRVAVMQHGNIVETADVDTLFASPKHPYTQSLLSARSGGIYA